MCQLCGCQQFIKKGKEAVLKRVADIIKELQVTPANTDDYECIETISGMIAPFGLQEDEVYQTAAWISGLHADNPQVGRGEQYRARAHAFRDIFARLPARGDPKHIGTTWHQLEQLAREVDEKTIASLDPDIGQAIQAVNHVHDDTTRAARIRERYNLRP